MSMNMVAILGIVILLILMFNGMNIGWAMLLVGFFGYAYVVNFKAAIGVLSTVPMTQASTYALTVIPLFILMGNFAFASGVSSGLYNACDKLLCRLPGGLACATVGACACFGAICGSVQATAATVGTVSIPEMRKYGYKDSLTCGTISVGGTIGIMIPPSSPMIIYGLLAMVSIGRLFSAGILPGILESLLVCVTVFVLIAINPSLAPGRVRYKAAEILRSLIGLIPMVILFGVVFVGMFTGWYTINEAAAAGAFVALLLMIVLKKFTWKAFLAVMKDTVKTSGMTYLILIGATVFGNFLTITNMPMSLAATVARLNVNRWVVFGAIVLIYFVMGMLMDALPMMMMTVPVFLPIMTQLGFDATWFGVIIILVMQLGLITPPVGTSCYVISGIARDVPLAQIFKGSLPFCIPLFVTIIILCFFPQIALWIPNAVYGVG